MEKTIWLHVKTQKFYAIHEIGLREYDLEPQFAYRRLGENNKPEGVVFYRTVREFLDGRFTQYQVNGVGGEVVNGQRPAMTGKLPEHLLKHVDKESRIHALDAYGTMMYAGDWMEPTGDMGSAQESWGKKPLPRQIMQIHPSGPDIRDASVTVAGDPDILWTAVKFRKAKSPMEKPSALDVLNEEAEEEVPTGETREASVDKPQVMAVDVDYNGLSVGDHVEIAGTLGKDRVKLQGSGPWQISKITGDSHPQIHFRGDKRDIGWYGGVFRKVSVDELP